MSTRSGSFAEIEEDSALSVARPTLLKVRNTLKSASWRRSIVEIIPRNSVQETVTVSSSKGFSGKSSFL